MIRYIRWMRTSPESSRSSEQRGVNPQSMIVNMAARKSGAYSTSKGQLMKMLVSYATGTESEPSKGPYALTNFLYAIRCG